MENLDSIIANLCKDVSFDFKKQAIIEDTIKTNLFNKKTKTKSKKQQVIDITCKRDGGDAILMMSIYCGDKYVKFNNYFDDANLSKTNGLKSLLNYFKKENYKLII